MLRLHCSDTITNRLQTYKPATLQLQSFSPFQDIFAVLMKSTGAPSSPIDPKSGFNRITRTYQSLRTPIELPPLHTHLTAAAYALYHNQNSPWSPHSVAFINGITGQRVSQLELIRQTQTLITHLKSVVGLSKGDTAFILSPNLIQVPVIYLALLSLGVIVSPGNPISTETEISHLIELCKPVIAFATSSTVHKLSKFKFQSRTIIIDSAEFETITRTMRENASVVPVEVSQSDTAAILYSSGTTGKVKGVMLTHRNLIAAMAINLGIREARKKPTILLITVPLFHVYGFVRCLNSVALNDTVVIMERFDMKKTLKAVQQFKVTQMAVAPPVIVALVKDSVRDEFDLSSLESVGCGGAPLGKDMAASFCFKIPGVVLKQAYGLTETTAGLSRIAGPEEASRIGAVGKLDAGLEAKIVDIKTGEALPPGMDGELWVRGPSIMKGYLGDEEATAVTLVKDGWLRTGDLCCFDDEGFLYVQDRLKDLIKYKGYQVAPAELEDLLKLHPDILDAAVIPYPDELAGQLPMTFIVREQQSRLSETEVVDFVARQVAPYKKIRRVAFVDSIPKNAAGKIMRRKLSETVIANAKSSSRL